MEQTLSVETHDAILDKLVAAAKRHDNATIKIYRKELHNRLISMCFLTKKILALEGKMNEETARSRINRAIRRGRLVRDIDFIKIGGTVLIKRDKGMEIIMEKRQVGRPKRDNDTNR